MKKIIGLTVAALMVMGLVGGGTWAYFSDTESTTGNVLAAGTLNLQVNSADPWASAPISITNIAPGDSTSNTSITVENTGNLAGDLYVRIGGFTDGGGDNPEPEQVAEAIHGVTDNISTMLTLNVSWNGTTAVTNLDGVTISTADGTWSGNYIDLAGGAAADSLLIGATLNSAADNKYQGDNCTFTIEFYLAQDGQSTP
jgi:predicted ribosomally synthesized peptide with SipW-like signal peptide